MPVIGGRRKQRSTPVKKTRILPQPPGTHERDVGMRIRWRRLLVNPKARVVARHGAVTDLRIDGLVCDTVCAVRARQALAALPGVRHVEVDYEAGTARVEGGDHDAAAYDRAIAGVVAGKPLRRAIEHVRQLFGRESP
jgi:hypothetical protein